MNIYTYKIYRSGIYKKLYAFTDELLTIGDSSYTLHEQSGEIIKYDGTSEVEVVNRSQI